MKVLIGTPIHICKDYCIERWLKNVSKLIYPADFLMVDNSPGLDYLEKVKGYCTKYGVANYKIEHVEIDPAIKGGMRIDVSEETIRRYVLSHNYDVWFSWECDQIIPTNALDELIRIMKAGNFMMVAHNCWWRESATSYCTDMGVTLIKRECLEKNWFLPQRNGNISLNESDRGEAWFKERVLKSGGNCVDVYGIINPIYHLKE